MSDKDLILEDEREKSYVNTAQDAQDREPAFDIEDEVQMRVEVKGDSGTRRTLFKVFVIAGQRLDAGRWQYQLNDPTTSSLWEAGKWFPESSLTSTT